MPDLPKFILTKFTSKSEVVGIYNALEDAEMIRSRYLRLEENGATYEIYTAIKGEKR